MKKINKMHLFWFGLILAILPYFYLCFFANPSADDFSLSGQAMQNDFLHLMQHNYFFWNGRYISNIFIYLNPIAFGSFIGYKIIPAFLLLLFTLANFIFLQQVFFQIKKQKQLIFSLILTLLFIHNIPIISEGIYWYTGAVIYLLGIISTLFYFSLLIRYLKGKRTFSSCFLLIVLLFLSCGFNEVLTLLMVFIMATFSYVFYKKQLPDKKFIIIQFLITCFFASLMIFAPGNELRGEAYQNAHNFSNSSIYSVLQVGRFSVLWIFSIPLLATSFLYFQINKIMRKENTLFQNSFYLNRWESLLFLFAIIFICVFPPYWATGILGQHRTVNVAYFFFLLVWFVNLTGWYNYYQTKLNFSLTKKIKISLAIFLLIGVMTTGNGYTAFFDVFSGSANNYNVQMKRRFVRLKRQNNESKKTIIFPKISNPPKSLSASDISNNPEDWTNKAYNLYFRLDSTKIILK